MQNTTEGKCECGCGAPAPIAKRSCSSTGEVIGEPRRFISGHNARGTRPKEHPWQKSPKQKERKKKPAFDVFEAVPEGCGKYYERYGDPVHLILDRKTLSFYDHETER